MISTTNTTALQILKTLQSNAYTKNWSIDWEGPPNRGPGLLGFGGVGPTSQIEPVSQAAKDAIAKITAIISETGGSVDLSGETYTHASVSAMDNATVVGGDGNDSVSVYSYATVDAGAGDDSILTYRYANVVAGEGDDWVYAGNHSKVDAGAGNDYVYGSRRTQVDGGDGNDAIQTYGYATVDGGEGDDFIVTYGGATVTGGDGNDIIVATSDAASLAGRPNYDEAGRPTSTKHALGLNDLDGGAGDDYIEVSGSSTVRGGTGNDTIHLMDTASSVTLSDDDREAVYSTGIRSTVTFAKGDGQDAIISRDDFNLSIAGYGKDDVTVTAEGDTYVVAFTGSDERIELNLSSGATAHLTFEDGSSMDVTGSEAAKQHHKLHWWQHLYAGEAL